MVAAPSPFTLLGACARTVSVMSKKSVNPRFRREARALLNRSTRVRASPSLDVCSELEQGDQRPVELELDVKGRNTAKSLGTSDVVSAVQLEFSGRHGNGVAKAGDCRLYPKILQGR